MNKAAATTFQRVTGVKAVVEEIRVGGQNRVAGRRGSVYSWPEKHDATRAPWNTPGASGFENDISVSG